MSQPALVVLRLLVSELPFVPGHGTKSGHASERLKAPVWPTLCLLCQMYESKKFIHVELTFQKAGGKLSFDFGKLPLISGILQRKRITCQVLLVMSSVLPCSTYFPDLCG